MSLKSKGDQGEYEFTRGAWEEQSHAEREFGVECVIHLEQTKQRGVYELTISAWKPTPDGLDTRLSSYVNTWPGSSPQSFGAFLYSSMYKLMRMVEEGQTRATVSGVQKGSKV